MYYNKDGKPRTSRTPRTPCQTLVVVDGILPAFLKVSYFLGEISTCSGWCRECEKITQPPAPFHVTPRGFAGPNLLAMILFEKFGQHQPLNRQSERYRREGIDLSVSTLANQVGACTTARNRFMR